MSRPRIGISEAQSDALYRRESPYTAASGASFKVNWSWDQRQPRDLRDAADMVRRAYADEVPLRMHVRDLAPDGTPRMGPEVEGFIFGGDYDGVTPRDKCSCRAIALMRKLVMPPDPVVEHHADCMTKQPPPALDYYRTPFRAALSRLKGDNPQRADFVELVATGQHKPISAMIAMGVPAWIAREAAEAVLFAFMRSLSDLKVRVPTEGAA